MMDEIWKDIELIPYYQAAWPFHQVSNYGRVRVLPGGRISSRIATEIEIRVLSPRNGYLRISQGTINHYIHILVLNAFVGPCPAGLECRHLNGNRIDNRWPENLTWGTHKENIEDQMRHGTFASGERNGASRLTEVQIREIRSRPYYYGINRALAKEFGVCLNYISRIRNYGTWRGVTNA